MGFTRYWRRPKEFDASAFRRFAAACDDACEGLQDILVAAEFDAEKVLLEGKRGGETFLIERVSPGRERNGTVSEFCKTQHFPYDEAVQRCLELLRDHFPEVTLSED